jgi:hypothetical protein
MDWFEALTGFREASYDASKQKLRVEGALLHSLVNQRQFGIGRFSMPSLAELRSLLATSVAKSSATLTTDTVFGDIGLLHTLPEYHRATVQVASQFNMLEMIAPSVTPEDGVARYASDPTQGPACAIAAGAATIYRNYFVPIGAHFGQTHARQLDGLADVGAALSDAIGRPVEELWRMRNGYALYGASGLTDINDYLATLDDHVRDALMGRLRIGWHRDVEVTFGRTKAEASTEQCVSQVFCSALPVAYSQVGNENPQPLAQLILDAAYEATFTCALLNAQEGGSKQLLLTRLGGGAFGNKTAWIDDAIDRTLLRFRSCDLNVKFVMRA